MESDDIMESDDNSGEEYAYDDGNESEDEEQFAEIKDTVCKQADGRLSTGTSAGKPLSAKIPDGKVVIVEYQEIVPLMEAITREVSTLLDIDYDSAETLLQGYRWDKERLIDAFFSNPEKVFIETGLDKYNHVNIVSMLNIREGVASSSASTTNGKGCSISDKFVCRICCDDAPSKVLFLLILLLSLNKFVIIGGIIIIIGLS